MAFIRSATTYGSNKSFNDPSSICAVISSGRSFGILRLMYVKKTKNKNLDNLTTIVGICMPLVTIPQLYSVITADDLQGVSLITWSFYTLQAGIFAIFSIKHKEKPLVITYIPLFVIEACIVVALILRGF